MIQRCPELAARIGVKEDVSRQQKFPQRVRFYVEVSAELRTRHDSTLGLTRSTLCASQPQQVTGPSHR